MATVRRLPSVEHNFQLVITKVYEDGDQDLLLDEDESKHIGLNIILGTQSDSFNLLADEEKVFLISEELEFRAGETDGEPNFVWRDLHGDVDEFFEFVASGTNGPTCAFFETCMYRAMYERKYKKNAENIQDTSLEEFVWRYVVPTTSLLRVELDLPIFSGHLRHLNLIRSLRCPRRLRLQFKILLRCQFLRKLGSQRQTELK